MAQTTLVLPDGGLQWTEVTGELPSDFGFPLAIHPHDPSTIYVIPHSRTATAVTVVASRPGTRVTPVTVRSRALESAAQWHYFPVHLQIPSRGTWRFQVTVGGDRGCFVASFT